VIWLAIAAGGAVSAMARPAVNPIVHAQWLSTRFPAGTLAANLIGCLAIGVLAGLVASDRLSIPLHWREFVFVGLLGGFTTFSTFGLDTFLLA
jgi:CrcB protein